MQGRYQGGYQIRAYSLGILAGVYCSQGDIKQGCTQVGYKTGVYSGGISDRGVLRWDIRQGCTQVGYQTGVYSGGISDRGVLRGDIR